MAGEIQLAYGVSGRTLYALVRNSVGEVWQTTTNTFVAYATADLANYDIPLAEQGAASGYYAGDFPAAIAAGVYAVAVMDRAGVTPAETDEVVGSGSLDWTGAVVSSLSGLPAAWGASVVGGGRTRDYFLQGGANRVDFAADGLTFTVYATDDTTVLYQGTATRLATTVGGLRGIDPA